MRRLVFMVTCVVALLFFEAQPASAGDSGGVSGAAATVQNLDASASVATIQTTNVSRKDITGYVITAVGRYASGKTEFHEHGHDYGPRITYEKNGLLRPGTTSQTAVQFSLRAKDPLQRVDTKVAVVIYSDQTAEVADERAFENHMRTRRSAASSLQESVKILRIVLNDPVNDHASAKAVEMVKEVVFSAKANHEEKDTGFLLEMQRDMEHAPERAATGNISEREFLQQYLAEKEKRAASFAEYSNVRRVQ